MSGDEGNLGEFLAEVEEILEAMADDLMELESSASEGDPDPESINSIFRGAHSLKGISSMFGFLPVTEVSHKMETLLDALRMGKISCGRPILDLLFEGVDLLKELCGQLANGGSIDDPRVAPFVEKLLLAANGETKQEEVGLASLGFTEEEMLVLTEYELHRIEETLKNPKRTLVKVKTSFPLESFDTDLESLNQEIKSRGEIISTLPSTNSMAEDKLDFDLLVGLKEDLDEFLEFAAASNVLVEKLGTPKIADSSITAPPLKSSEEKSSAKKSVSEDVEKPGGNGIAAREGSPIDSSAANASGNRAAGEIKSLAKTIRVDLPKLDALMNLVGELVMSKGRIQILSDKLRAKMGFSGEALELIKAQKELERKLSEMQQAVMDVRMVPLGQLFSKLHRAMRKILSNSKKEIDLKIFGADTELDKMIVEDLSDPLIHVIRNSVDHGIEEPEVRMVRNKPTTGVITISASQRGNHVVIEVSDDGAGLSKEKIKNKAIEKGLISANAQMEDKDLFDLIFLPGFSTKEQVSEISGRGVGMDVLRKNIAGISGIIELWSEDGKGTTVTIVLPITLAIIQALLVDIGGSPFAIPLNSVLETLALEPEQMKSVEGCPVIHLRESTLPFARIDGIFGMNYSEEIPPYAVVVGVADRRVAFAVDDLVSQQDVVIKSLGKRLQGLRGLAGATDLGDQKTIPVLDVAALVDEVYSSGSGASWVQ